MIMRFGEMLRGSDESIYTAWVLYCTVLQAQSIIFPRNQLIYSPLGVLA
jgi:hypothetical protein